MEEFLKLFSVRDILLHMVNTLILLGAVTFFVYKPVRKFMRARTERVQALTDGAHAKEMEAAQTLSQAEARVRDAEGQAARAQADGAVRAQQAAEQLLAAAKAQAADITRKAQEEAEHRQIAAREEMQAEALGMAVEIAEKMIGRELAQRDNAALAREFITKVG